MKTLEEIKAEKRRRATLTASVLLVIHIVA